MKTGLYKTDIKSTIETYNEFLTNASHNSKREPPLNCSCTLTDMEHLICGNEVLIWMDSSALI